MGLAPYGEPRFMEQMRRIVRLEEGGSFELDLRFFGYATGNYTYQWSGGSPHVGTLFTPAVEALLGPARKPEEKLDQRHFDMARSTQAMFEEAAFHLYNTLHRRHAVDAIAIAGVRLQLRGQRAALSPHALSALLRPGSSRRFRRRGRCGL